MDTNTTPQPDERLKNVDPAELEAYINKRLEEEHQKQDRASALLRLESLEVIRNLLILFVLGLFVVSPLIQLIVRIVTDSSEKILLISSYSVKRYQWTIRNINRLARFTAVLTLLWVILVAVLRRREAKRSNIPPAEHIPLKERLGRLVPFFIFGAFVIGIIVVTKVRGANEYDLTGHPYMYESIYSYMSYPLVYFFCGAMLYSDKMRKVIVYILLFSALPMNVLVLVSEWITPIKYFGKTGEMPSAVFHNSNHYGYYLAITIAAGVFMFVYEKKLWLRIAAAVSAAVAAVALIINDTLGAYLAVAFVLILFIVYSFFVVKKNRALSLIIFGAFILLTFLMSFKYNTVFSSIVRMTNDIGAIIADPLEADGAGSLRWKLWKGTVSHLGERPLTGFGVEGLLNTYGVGTPHNEFLQYAEFFGIPVAVLYIAACLVILIRVLKNSKTLSPTTMICFFVSICYLASSFFGVAIYYTTPFVYIFLGLTYAEYLKYGKRRPADTPAEVTVPANETPAEV